MIIAFTGASGSGKTTLINTLKEWNFLKSKKIIVKKEDDFLTFEVIRFLLGDKLFTRYKEEKFFDKKEASVGTKVFSFLVYWFYPIVVYLELLWLHIVYSIIFKSHVLLSDRYVYDYIVTFKKVLNIYNPIAKVLLNNFPKPYLTFYLKISKKTAVERNKNNIKGKITASPLHHEKVVEEYASLALKNELLPINAEANFQDVKREIERYILAKSKLSSVASIAISGIDGAGKTTACNNLGVLSEKVGIPSKVVHFYHVSLLHKLLGKKGGSRHKPPTTPKNKSFIWALLNFIDSYIQYFYFINKYRGSLIIFDRYFHDYLVSFGYRNVPTLNFFNRLIIKPDKSFILLTEPTSAQKRTNDALPGEYFNNVHALYSKIARGQNQKVIQVDKKTPDEIVDEIIKSI